eukprot:TRINITY_DN1787_c0_g1_i3.p2 TRINITY_DN1787_c0_g1~~TRINITY_DN1787_c0_g1_i3.p2  ORF type:complete len:116 (+),score=10.85 TRINITY_DN1787_c0_g1_i3:128-475(+)
MADWSTSISRYRSLFDMRASYRALPVMPTQVSSTPRYKRARFLESFFCCSFDGNLKGAGRPGGTPGAAAEGLGALGGGGGGVPLASCDGGGGDALEGGGVEDEEEEGGGACAAVL